MSEKKAHRVKRKPQKKSVRGPLRASLARGVRSARDMSTLKKVLWVLVSLLLVMVVAVVVSVVAMWMKGTLPTRAELPRLRDKFFYHIDRYMPSRLPEAEVLGIDVSHYQGTIRWDELSFHIDKSRKMHSSSGKRTKPVEVDFVVCKCTEGSAWVDPFYSVNKDGARQRGVMFGAYHFFSPSSSARRQAEHFIRHANLHKGDIVPILDVEEFKKSFPSTDSVLVWLKYMERYYGAKPLIYTGQNAFNTYFANDKRFADYGFWLARYGGHEPDHHHVFWQAMENGRVGGIQKMVDVNVFRGTKTDLKYKYTIR